MPELSLNESDVADFLNQMPPITRRALWGVRPTTSASSAPNPKYDLSSFFATPSIWNLGSGCMSVSERVLGLYDPARRFGRDSREAVAQLMNMKMPDPGFLRVLIHSLNEAPH
jgi:hypothetical protein